MTRFQTAQWALVPCCVLSLAFLACATSKTHFRNEQVHHRYDVPQCGVSVGQGGDVADVYDAGRRILPAIDACLVPQRVFGDEQIAVCQYYKAYAKAVQEGKDEAEADRQAVKPLVEQYDRYREQVEERARVIRNVLQRIQEQSPQTSMLYLLEARLYLLTGYALDHQLFLLAGHDHEAAQEWYRKVLPRTQKAVQSHKSYGLAFLYRADALARLGRCDEATQLVTRLQDDGYKSSSTQALLAFCAAVTGDEDNIDAAIEGAIDASDRESAASWASHYRKYLAARAEWKVRGDTARIKEELGLVLDDGRSKGPIDRIRMVEQMEPWLLARCR